MKLGERGLSIVQVLIATAMLGALSLGVMQVSKNMTDVNRNANSSLEVLMLKQEMLSIINDSNDCTNSLTDNIPFKKSDIDNKQTEGRDVELFFSNLAGNQRGKKRFSATDPLFNKYGSIEIRKIKLVLDSVTTPLGDNYPPGVMSDRGLIVVELEKKDGKDLKFDFPLKVSVETDASYNTLTKGCAGDSAFSIEKHLVIHSQSTVPATCPPGWIQESDGYSFILAAIAGGMTATQDLADRGSCLKFFRKQIHIECEKPYCDPVSPGDYTSWLYGGGSDTNSLPSRCAICTKKNTVVKVLHSQSNIDPPCPGNMTPLWTGYSLLGVTIDYHMTASFRLDDPGSCLKDYKNGAPHIECEYGVSGPSECKRGTARDFAWFLTTDAGSNQLPTVGHPLGIQYLSKCVVCEGRMN